MIAPELPALPLSLALVGFTERAALRDQLEWAASHAFRAVQLNAAAPGARPRELGRSARRDIAAMLRRNALSLSGIDLWIPVSHYLDPAHADHAITSACDAIDYAAELAELTGGRAQLSLSLPADQGPAGRLLQTLAERCQRVGARVADHAWPPAGAQEAQSPIGIGIDPATVLLHGAVSPDQALLEAGSRLAAARLTDLSAAGRVTPGQGRLDLLAYLVAASTAPGALPLVVDLRGIADQARAADALVNPPRRA